MPETVNRGMDARDEDALMIEVLTSNVSRAETAYRYCLRYRICDWPYAEKLILEDLAAALAYHQHLKIG